MISRRNIRVKVMQTVYAVETQEAGSPKDPVKLLENQFEETRALFLYIIYFLTEVSRYAETDARARASKHLPSEKDLQVNTKIAGNQLLWRILEHESYRSAVAELKPERIHDAELMRRIYQDLVKSEEYNQYIQVTGREKSHEKHILEFIFTDLMLPNELFTSFIEEKFNSWDDDAEMINSLMMNFLSKPASFNLQEIISKEKWEFAKSLMETCLDKKEVALEYIRPRLKNWEPERIAILDMILMRMGVCEFLFFETIPPKVTINEYIDLAKEYSTHQSGQFVNGILDSIHKDLVRENKMHKVAFRPS